MKFVIPTTPQDKFHNWYAGPLATLATLKDGDGAFIAFGISLALFERYVRALLKRKGINGSAANFRLEAGLKDTSLSRATSLALTIP